MIHHALLVMTGLADSITVEDSGEIAQGSEFTVRRGTEVQAHQLKRQNRTINNWSVASLDKLNIWRSARHHVESGRHFHFTSEVPAPVS